MIPVGLFLPLIVGGVAGAVWRELQKRRQVSELELLPVPYSSEQDQPKVLEASAKKKAVFDDVGELYHYQRVSWYALAFSASGAWFYAPVLWVSYPLIGYNAFYFLKTIRHSGSADQKSPMTVFETIGIAGTMISGRPILASSLLVFSFGMRKLLLQAGNISNSVASSRARGINPRSEKVWVLRDGAEVESLITSLQDNDIVIIRAGETIPIKGKIVEGEGTVHQFSLHKKMKYVPKIEGDYVFPFTYLESGYLQIKVS